MINVDKNNVSDSYDKSREKVAVIKDALHLNMKFIFSKLPKSSNILCIGAGTGTELIYLANQFPKWRFTAIDPSEKMIEICKKRIDEAEITERCMVYKGTLNSFNTEDTFNGITSILVSHYLQNSVEKLKFFNNASKLLNPEGIFINADLAFDNDESKNNNLSQVWNEMQSFSGMSNNVNNKNDFINKKELESMLQSSGFSNPILFYQNLFIHAWFSQVPAVEYSNA